jgi:hypothetical protein
LDRWLTIPPFKNVAYYEISQHRVHWLDTVNTTMTLIILSEEFHGQLGENRLHKKDSASWSCE